MSLTNQEAKLKGPKRSSQDFPPKSKFSHRLVLLCTARITCLKSTLKAEFGHVSHCQKCIQNAKMAEDKIMVKKKGIQVH